MDSIVNDSPETPAGADTRVRANVALKTRAADALARHNPFYLLSAMSMLAACLLLANSLSWSPIPFGRLLALLGILNLYELLLLGLGLFLSRRGNFRDATQLLVLAAVFLADAAFLNSEVVTHSLTTGLLLNATLLLLATGKFAITARILNVPFDAGRLVSVAILFALLFGLPAWLKTVDRAHITGVHLYACWWAAMLAAVAYELVTGRAVASSGSSHRWGLITTLFIAIPMFSLLTHIGILHYVYNEPFAAAHAAPILLLLAIVLGRVPGPIAARIGIPSAKHARIIQGMLPLFAVFISSSARFTLEMPFAGPVSPFVLTLVAAVFTYALTLFRPHAFLLIVLASAAGIVYVMSPSAATYEAAARRLKVMLENAINLALSLVPSTRLQWGVVALITAFGLLAIGARISMRRPLAADPVSPPPAPDLG